MAQGSDATASEVPELASRKHLSTKPRIWLSILQIIGVFGTLSACAVQEQTASGNLDIVLPTNNRQCVVDKILNGALSSGYTPKSQTENSIIVERETKNVAAQILLSSEAYSTVNERISIFLVPDGAGNTRMVLKGEYVSNPGSAFEHVVSSGAPKALQDQLSENAQNIVGVCPKLSQPSAR